MAVRYTALGVLLALLVGFFVYDFVFVEPHVAADYELNGQSPPIAADLLLQNVRYDPTQRGRLVADLTVDVRSIKDIAFSGDAAFAVRTIDRKIPWLLTRTGKCSQVSSAVAPDPETAYTAHARFACGDVELAIEIASDDLWYPFDGYTAELSLRGCINKVSPCDLRDSEPGLPIRFVRLRVEPGERHFVATVDRIADGDQSVRLSLKRRFFLRVVSVLLAAMALVYIAFLVRSDPQDTMLKALGLFGSLWALRSLLLPPSITAFPTLVDFSVLAMFSVAFLVVLWRVSVAQGV